MLQTHADARQVRSLALGHDLEVTLIDKHVRWPSEAVDTLAQLEHLASRRGDFGVFLSGHLP